MSPSDKNKSPANSKTAEAKTQECSKLYLMDSQLEPVSSSKSDVTKPGHGTITNIPLITASQSTFKCSINDEMKAFDPGENGGNVRLTSNHCGNSTFPTKNNSLLKNINKNYKAGSKINKLADMLAKRSQNVVEVTQNNTSDIISGITCGLKEEGTEIMNSVSNVKNIENNLNNPSGLKKTAAGRELDSSKKNRRKSVPNESCKIHQLKIQPNSKSCLDFSKLFSMEDSNMNELNALGGSLKKLQTDESTKKKAVRKNLKNVELSLILPEKKRRSSMRTENLAYSKGTEKTINNSLAPVESQGKHKTLECCKEIVPMTLPSSLHNVSSKKIKKKCKVKQRKSKRLVETSTQTADIEFISVVKSKPEVVDEKLVTEGFSKPTVTYECLYCTQTFALGSQCKAHEKTHSQKNSKLFIKCQYCSKKLPSLVEINSHCIKKHPNKCSVCLKCNEKFISKEELSAHCKELHVYKNENIFVQDHIDEAQSRIPQEKKRESSEEQQTDKKVSKQSGVKTDLKIDVSFDSSKKSSVSPRNVQKSSPKETKTEEQLLEMEMLFYSHLSGNIHENLTNHLDGKLDKSGNPVRTDQIKESIDYTIAKSKSNSLLSVVTPSSSTPDVQTSRAPSPYQTRSKTPNPLPPTAKKFKKLPNWQQKFWEKYNFPTNYRYEHRFWDKNYLNTEKSAFYLKDLSCLDIKTQLTMRENIKKLDNIKVLEENSKGADNLKFPEYLSLVPRVSGDQETTTDLSKNNISEVYKSKAQIRKEKGDTKKSFKSPIPELPVMKTRRKLSLDNSSSIKKQSEKLNLEGIKMITRRQSSIDLNLDKEDSSRKRKGSLDISGSQRMTLRRQTSLDTIHGNNKSKMEKGDKILELNLNDLEAGNTPLSPTGSAEISGEWVRPRSYLCGTCCAKFTNLWELEDHKWVTHPNVWCTHYEFEDEKIDKLFQKSENDGKEINSENSVVQSNLKLTDLYKRYLLPYGSLKTAKLVPNTTFPEQCTKCKKNCMNSSEMHKHMLDCGGDTTWFLTMYSSPMTIKRKWRPFGSRRRKQIGRRDIKRNIPSTPTLRSYHYQHRIRTKPGDVETIQKMLANLPEKRARRAINFDEIKTRSQATIHSNRLLRKRLRTSFTANFLNLKNRRNHQLNKGKKEISSKSTTDASSESTPVGSPKRKNKSKENNYVKVEIVKENLEELPDKEEKCNRKKSNIKVNEIEAPSTLPKTNTIKSNKRKAKAMGHQVKLKPITRSNNLIPESTLHNTKSTRHIPIVKEENITNTSSELFENISGVVTDSKKLKENLKTGKKAKSNNKINQIKEEFEFPTPEVCKSVLEINDKKVVKVPKKLGKKKLNLKANVSQPDVNSNISKKKKDEACIIRSDRILRMKQNRKEKTELIKRIKKKLKNSKKVLELKDIKKVARASRRSQRIRSLQMSEETSGISETKDFVMKTEINESFQRDTKLKNALISLQNARLKNLVKVVDEKESKRNTNEELKKTVNLVENIRPEKKYSRSLRNSISFEGKQEESNNAVPEKIFGNIKKSPFLRRNSKTGGTPIEPIVPGFVEAVPKHKKAYRIQNVRILRRENPCRLITGGQISLLKKNRIQTTSLDHLGEASEPKNFKDILKRNDLSEMPILARVEPIRGKSCVKNETEIPILMPIEKEPGKDTQLDEKKQTPEKGVVSFQVIKNKRKTSKEITPLKIVKKVENITAGNSKDFAGSFSLNGKHNSGCDNLSSGKNRKRKNPVKWIEKRIDLDEKRNKNSESKKYFLGICPNEIDKGRINVPDDSGSDSEPLISLISNQKELSSTSMSNDASSELTVKQDLEGETANSQYTLSPSIKQVSDTINKIKANQIAETTPYPLDVPLSCKHEEKIDDVTVPLGKIDVKQSVVKKELKIENKKISKCRKIKNAKTPTKKLRMTVTLKEPTLKILDKSPSVPTENKWTVKVPEEKAEIESKNKSLQSIFIKEESVSDTSKENVFPERRSRRISKEIKASNEFIIDDPLILVDELWSDLDSDSDCSKKKSKKGKKKTFKKKNNDEKRVSDVKLEELLRNFGENKEIENSQKSQEPLKSSTIKVVFKKCAKTCRSLSDIRKSLEIRQKQESNNRLSLKLFRFRKPMKNFGNRGEKLSDVKKALKERQDEMEGKSALLPDLPFLAAEIKENPLQVIQCGSQKTKSTKKIYKKFESKSQNSKINFKISLPLESINNMAIFNNNHLTELMVEESPKEVKVIEETSQNIIENECFDHSTIATQKENQISQETIEPTESCEFKNKPKRSEVIDKIFYCEICKTYYYSSSQLKIHKLSNRHKLKESELAKEKLIAAEQVNNTEEVNDIEKKELSDASLPVVESILAESSKIERLEPERQNDDTLEMPTLEGPFIENPLTRVEVIDPVPSMPPINTFGFSQESLKDIQQAIGCTDEEMLILTLLGENTIEIENDILDLDSCKSGQSKMVSNKIEKVADPVVDDKANGSFKVDLKQRMTSALACLVNKAVYNLLQKYESTTKTAVNPEALSFLGKISNLSRRKNILQLNDLLKKQNDGESSIITFPKDLERKEPIVPYKYQCTICGSRFEKASTRECHISRSHKGKAKKTIDEVQAFQTVVEDDWNDSWNYENNEDHLVNANSTQFWCSDCGINFLSPQEVLEHQKLEHQAGVKEAERSADAGPLQSSTIGSSDEIVEGKKARPRPKLFSSEELDQQRIIANNELRKLDRKFTSKNKSSKNKWGMDALKFTVEKENKMIAVEDEKTTIPEDNSKQPGEAKNIDLIPKLNLSRTGNIPEFKVIQKSSFKNRFQKIIDNKLKRRITRHSQNEPETDDMETEVMLLPVVVKKKSKKPNPVKYISPKDENEKVIDVYDFNESESEIEPMVFSHIKKTVQPAPKLKLVKLKEGPSKNKADSTTKDLSPDDYDSEDSLPLSIVKKSKAEEDDDKDEKTSEEGVEKSEGILEQVEYLIEQLENETGPARKKKEDERNVNDGHDLLLRKNKDILFTKEDITSEIDSIDSIQETFRVSLTSRLLQLESTSPNNKNNSYNNKNETLDIQAGNEGMESVADRDESVLAEPESSQSIFDDEDSMPLVLMSKKAELTKSNEEEKKCDENSTDLSTTASEDARIFRADENKSNEVLSSPSNSQPLTTESSLPLFSFRDNEKGVNEKPFEGVIEKPFKPLNENTNDQNESLSEFGSDSSNDGLIHSNFENSNLKENNQNYIKEITEKEDVVIVCSRRDEEESNESKDTLKNFKSVERKKKKRFPLLTATIEENNFRKSESPKHNKEVIVRKIWNRRKIPEGGTDNEENSFSSVDNDTSIENIQKEESQTEVEKEIIVKKIWSRKRLDHDGELSEKPEEKFHDMKINQTEVSDEVIIKCGPKAKQNPKRRKSRSSTNESSKETIMRKIWSGKCFQTKAALKTYDSDMLSNSKENNVSEEQTRPKKRGRPSGLSSTKRSKVEEDNDEDDLDSLLEEIEREQLEKAIRLEFLHMRRSEKSNGETMKDNPTPTVGLFTETNFKSLKKVSDRKRKKVRKKIKPPRQSILKRRKFIKKPIRKILQTDDRPFNEGNNHTNCEPVNEQSENSLEKNCESFDVETKIKNRKHKKHRHKHHHHKHKHKKSKHHKSILNKHKSKHKLEAGEGIPENAESFSILEKICQDIPNQIENEWQFSSKKISSNSNLNDADSSVMEQENSPFSFENKTKDYDDMELDLSGKDHFESENRSIYDFVEDISDLPLKDN